MTAEKKIVWIGEKPIKKVNTLGRDYYFNRGEPTSVPEQVAHRLLQIKSCFATPESAQSLIESLQAEEQKRQQLTERAAQLKAEEEKANTWLVMVDGEVVNISKYTKAKLETVILAEELPIDPLALEVPEGETHASALRMAVRDKLHAKHGIPEA
ncbi:hypothetical protein RII68_001924 [Vibrio parahaemolyticus]|uniref:hypothetical protein n=1 Tax=Vibrio parahaemolyticus TaxID=670 RepID=UPI00061AE269|nr:hypothetical protein [Vibrio parahaemolyticus]EGQ8311309.1 hypothetical protein [Vibrio parahaemolyticus]EGR1219989.1 hypothetical protein [Vibrio parahaemolyticus]EGR1765332.1 hypothetical protein [Vibrio parahaemolyticus]EID7775393.1 hypothetical protein [Vibrio parahaemolyticus]EII2404443.1 hypothetical protein [Vibrio parahaemolyticus]